MRDEIDNTYKAIGDNMAGSKRMLGDLRSEMKTEINMVGSAVLNVNQAKPKKEQSLGGKGVNPTPKSPGAPRRSSARGRKT